MKFRRLLALGMIPLLALTSCGRNKIDNNEETPQEQTPSGETPSGETPSGGSTLEVTYENFLAAYEKTKALSNVTVDVSIVSKMPRLVNDSPRVYANYTNFYYATIENDGGKIKNNEFENDLFEIKISDVLESSGFTKEQFDAYFNEYKYDFLYRKRKWNSETEYTFVNDPAKDIASVFIEYEKYEEYFVYLEEDKQWAFLDEEDDVLETYLYEIDGPAPYVLLSFDEMVYGAENISVSGNKISYTSEERQCSVEVTFDGEYLGKAVLSSPYQGEEMTFTIEFTKRNTTNVTLPPYGKIQCKYGNHEHCRYYYSTNEEYHVKYCAECEKFLGEPEKHQYGEHDYGICLVCGYNSADHTNRVPAGFEDVESSPYPNDGFLMVVDSEKGLYDTGVPKMPSVNIHVGDELSEEAAYYTFPDDHVAMVFSCGEVSYQGCLKTQPFEAKLYRNVDNMFFQNLKGLSESDQIAAFRSYMESNAAYGTYSNTYVELEHASTGEKIGHQLSSCAVFAEEVCIRCGEQIDGDYINNHLIVSDGYELVDPCHSVQKGHCTVCNEIFYTFVHTEHQGTPVISYEPVDECHRFVVTTCPGCGEELDVELEHNPTSTKDIVTHPTPCKTVTTTICEYCHCVTNVSESYDHGELQHKKCTADEVVELGLRDKLPYGVYYEFDYCPKCGEPVGNVKVYSSDNCNIEHDFEGVQSNNAYNYNYEEHRKGEPIQSFPHVLDDDGKCILCGAKVMEFGDFEFVTVWSDFLNRFRFFMFDKNTGQDLIIDSERHNTNWDDESTIFTFDEIEGLTIKKYYDEESGFVVSYQGENTTITRADFE